MNPADWLAEIKKLSIDDRIWLVQEIWNSVAEETPVWEPTEAQKRELDRRIADLDANPDDVLTWEEVKASLRDGDEPRPERGGPHNGPYEG